MLVETQNILQMKKLSPSDVHAIILLVENSRFGCVDKPYYEKICGREMNEYLRDICFDFKISATILEENRDVLETIRPFLDDSETTVVLFSSTPLLSRETLMAYLEKFVFSDDRALVMPKGFIAKTSYLKSAEKIESFGLNSFGKNEFFEVNSFADLEQAERFMQGKILDFHMQNGVRICDKFTVKIDADVDIEKGAKILPFTQILGKSFIGSGAEISSSIIKNCKVGENAKIENCNLEFCQVESGARVKPFTCAQKKEIKGAK